MITSVSNERIKNIIKLRRNKYIRENGKFIIEGDNLIEEALKQKKVDEIFTIEPSFEFDNTTKVSRDVMKKLSVLDSIPNSIAVCNTFDEIREFGNKIVLLDDIQDPGNLGTIIRNSVAFNVDTLVLSSKSVSVYNDKVLRATGGMIFNINVVVMELNEAIKDIKEKGIKVFATTLDSDSRSIYALEKIDKYAIIFGNEGSGIKEELIDYSDETIHIKMNEKCESLNVGVSSGIILSYLGDR